MENFYDYEETLCRLYEIRARLDDAIAYEFQQLEDASDGPCADCARHDKRWEYGSLRLCKVCARSRLAVKQLLREPAGCARDPLLGAST